MLEQMRRQGASIFIYLIFGLLIAIFVININPGQKGGGGGCGTASNTAVAVAGSKVNRSAYKIAYSNQFNWARGGRGREHLALDTLIRRELLVQAAAERGIRVSGDLVDEEIKKGIFFTFVPPPPGQQFQWPVSASGRVQLGENVFDTHDDGTKTWNFKKWKQWVSALDVTPGTYREEQERAMQASLISDLLMASVRVSREEALAEFLFEGNTVTYDTVAFDPAKYRAAMKLTDADIDRFLKTHEDDVKAKYKAEAATYKGTSQQLKLREIFIAKAEPPPPAPEPEKKPDDKKPAPAAGSGSGTGSGSAAPPKKEDKKPEPPKPVGLPIEEAKTKLEAARTAITGGKQKFADAAKTLSSDEQLKNSNGDIGWHKAADAQLGDKTLNDAVKAMKPGDVSPVIATDKGVYLITAEDKREGDLSYDQVKTEIAGDLARDVWSKEAAKRAAFDAIALAKKDGKPLDQLFEKDLELTPSQRRQLEQQIREQMQKQGAGGGDDHGALEVIERDTPAAWKADKDGSSGSGSGSAAAPAKAPPPAPKVITASSDQLPAFGDVAKPKSQHHGPTPRVPELEGLPKDAVPVVFDELRAKQVSDKVFESEGNFVIVGLSERGQPKMEEFDKNADRVLGDLRELRARMLIEDFLKTRCEELQKDNKIKPAAELVRETDDQGNPLPTTYKPCSSFSGQ